MLLRDARAALRRIDVLAAQAFALEDPIVPAVAEVRREVERIVAQLGHREQAQQRQRSQAVHRGR